MDKRIVKTRKLLQQALLALLRDVPFEAIDIQSITDKANTARVTFYRHYGTKEELLTDTLEGFYQDIQTKLTDMSLDRLLEFGQTPSLQVLFEFLDQDRGLYKNLLTGSASALIQRRIRYYLVKQIVLAFSTSPHYADLPVILIANNMASQVIGNVMWWLDENLPYSAEYMARLTHWMTFSAIMIQMGRTAEIKMPTPDGWQAIKHATSG